MTKIQARPSKSKPYHHGNLRPTLVAAGRQMLEQDGLEKLSLRGLARRAGVSQTAPYHHFKDKQALLAAIAEEGFRDLDVAMLNENKGKSERSPEDILILSGIAYVEFAIANQALFRLMFGGQIEDKKNYPALLDAANASYQKLEETAAALIAQSGGDDAAYRGLLVRAWAMVHGLATLLIDGSLTPEDYGCSSVRQLACLALEGCRLY